MSVRVRFAPSPTGYLHVGGLRTALYNFLFAKKHNGTFILRIEDTDQSRKVEGAMENLIATLKWAGINFDEGPDKDGSHGPYIQSQRLSIYKEHAEQLIKNGKAYYCFCTAERLEEVRKQQSLQGLDPKYDGHCRTITIDEARRRIQSGESHVVRMRVPDEGEVKFTDMIRGDVSIQNKILDDQVLLKSDGYPTYHLAVVVDDHQMEISHVVRGEEWLPSTPKHVLLYQYFGWDVPKFAHLPLLLNPDKSKLSKRQGDVAVEDYRSKGYLKEALVNFVALLGWNPGDEREIFSLDELIKEFSFERVGKAGAVFNIEKLNWMNQQHIKLKSTEELLPLVRPLIQEKGWKVPDAYVRQVIGLMKERVVVLGDFVGGCPYFYQDPTLYDEAARAKNWKPESAEQIMKLAGKFESLTQFDAATIESALRSTAEEFKIGAGKLIHPLRLALSGVANGPSLFHMAEVLGKDAVLRRIGNAIERLR
ncbi:MAG: glutamate--tRNA ligase [Bacteroidota bacterium]